MSGGRVTRCVLLIVASLCASAAARVAATDTERAQVISASVNPPLAMPLTQSEQAGRISGLTSQVLGRRLFPTPIEAIPPAPYIQRDYRLDWRQASLEGSLYDKQRHAQRIGDQGRARFAAERGWQKLLRTRGRKLRIGPDSPYWDPGTGKVRALEAKGGGSSLKITYASQQGTNLNAIRSAEGVLKSANASRAEHLAAARVIKAAQVDQLESAVIRTKHVQGTPETPLQEGLWDRSSVAKEATEIEMRLKERNPELKSTFSDAEAAQSADLAKFRTARVVAFLGLAGSGMLGWDAYMQTREAWLAWNDSVRRHTALRYLESAIAVGRWGESASLGLGSAAQLGLLGQDKVAIFGRAAGKWFFPLAVGVEGLSAGKTYYEYRIRRISQLGFYHRTTGPVIFGIFTTGGAIVGGCFGAAEGGIGAAPGAFIGAQIGAVVAIPFQMTADWGWNWYYRKFDEHQRAAVDGAVESFYGVNR